MTQFYDLANTIDYDDIFAFYGALSPEGFLLDLKGKIFAETQTEPELLIGHKFTDTVFWQANPHVAEVLEKTIEDAARGGKSKIQAEFRVSAKKTSIVELTLNPVSENRAIKAISFYAVDVTEREQEIAFYKERGERFLYAAESAEIGLWFWDLKENKIESTPTCNELYGLPPHGIMTYDIFLSLLHPEDSERVTAALRESQVSGSEYDIEYRIIYPDGRIQSITARGRTFYDAEDNPLSMMGVVRKTSEKQFSAEELTQVYERERRARDEAEEANRAKDYFLAFVSHELRSPLNSILGWTKILLTKEVDEKTRRSALETIERGAKSQAKLIEDLVDSARISSGKLRLELRPVNLYEIVSATVNSHKPAAEGREIDLSFEFDSKDAQVFGDSVRLQQVFTNLLTNALKFTPDEGEIRVRLKTDANLAFVAIEDNGQGISPSLLPKIFRRYVQNDDKVSRDRTGLGLGLSIVKTLIEKHGGGVLAESDGEGKGAKFTITLPLIAASVETTENEPIRVSASDERRLNGLKIMIVEDDPDSREVLKLFLEQSGADVESAESAPEAMHTLLQNANRGVPDIIISDLAMPVEDGYTFIGKIRQIANSRIKQIPALALSAFASAENKERAYASGFQKYHTKPFEPDLILSDILQLVGKEKTV